MTTKLNKKPTLIKVGKHYISIDDVSCIKQANAKLYIVKLRSEPNAEWPIWVEKNDIADLLEHFNIIESVEE